MYIVQASRTVPVSSVRARHRACRRDTSEKDKHYAVQALRTITCVSRVVHAQDEQYTPVSWVEVQYTLA